MNQVLYGPEAVHNPPLCGFLLALLLQPSALSTFQQLGWQPSVPIPTPAVPPSLLSLKAFFIAMSLQRLRMVDDKESSSSLDSPAPHLESVCLHMNPQK